MDFSMSFCGSPSASQWARKVSHGKYSMRYQRLTPGGAVQAGDSFPAQAPTNGRCHAGFYPSGRRTPEQRWCLSDIPFSSCGTDKLRGRLLDSISWAPSSCPKKIKKNLTGSVMHWADGECIVSVSCALNPRWLLFISWAEDHWRIQYL